MPLPEAATSPEEFDLLIKWLESYQPKELFHTDVDSSKPQAKAVGDVAAGIIDPKALRIIPRDQSRRMGMVDVCCSS